VRITYHAPARGTGSDLVAPKSPASPNPYNPRALTLRARDQSSDRSLREYQRSVNKSRRAEQNEIEAWITYQPRSSGNGEKEEICWSSNPLSQLP